MLRYLNANEKLVTRALYKEVFDDTDKFLDYYYEGPVKQNEIIGKFIDEALVAMMHLVPKEIFIKGKKRKACYLYAIATKSEYRRQGILKEMMEQALEDLKSQGLAFVYLIPEDSNVYLKYGFETIRQGKKEKLIPREKELKGNLSIKEMTLEDIDLVQEFFSKNAGSDMYIARTKTYYKDMLKRQKAERGSIELLYKESKLVAYAYVSAEDELVISEILGQDTEDFLRLIASKYDKEDLMIFTPELMVKVYDEEIKFESINNIILNEIL